MNRSLILLSVQRALLGAERVAGAGATRGGVLSPSEISVARSFGQKDGATVRIHQVGDVKIRDYIKLGEGDYLVSYSYQIFFL